jgi:hypothetical protein
MYQWYSPSCIALSFDGFGSISWPSIWFFRLFYSLHNISDYQLFRPQSTTDESWLVEMRIWCIQIGIVLVLYFNPWVEASAGGLLVPDGLFSPVAKYLGTCLKYEYE